MQTKKSPERIAPGFFVYGNRAYVPDPIQLALMYVK